MQMERCTREMARIIQRMEQRLPRRRASLEKKRNHAGELGSDRERLQYAEKINLEEELVRLKSHYSYLLDAFAKGHPIGRLLGFILQEMLREVNTIGAKAQDTQLQHAVIRAKELLEELKEQAQNLL